ncbi:splicing factor U2AF 35 kDa subunit [Achlya hypogyna]|uniref:Splicing factor U2AF 35 kDa subunit n=1 Tax=Achlya hypogyna TaxID=1202772 RepID=A0A1V9ZKQ9_ACHHY|nr:splicing factor U2AF 35 kDa subunit [Achlya hypogyna]
MMRRDGPGVGGGAEHLARIHGTEEDRVNCPFYFKIGACRHGDRCSRLHNKPVFSQTILVKHMYQNPLSVIIAANGDPSQLDQKSVDEDFEDFFEEVFEELCKFGKVDELNVCDNLGDHLVGNVYAKFDDEECAAAAQKALYGRFYGGRPLICEFSPVTDFREARCRQFDEGTCNRGGYCNFMHIKMVSNAMMRELERHYNTKDTQNDKDGSRSRSRSRSRRHRRSRSRSPKRRRSPDGHRRG